MTPDHCADQCRIFIFAISHAFVFFCPVLLLVRVARALGRGQRTMNNGLMWVRQLLQDLKTGVNENL